MLTKIFINFAVIPGIIAAVTMAVFDDYTSVKYCWISPTVAIYTLAIPVGAILAVNVAVAVYTMYKMTCGFKVKSVYVANIRWCCGCISAEEGRV